ncbi:transglutaminase family protein [Brooklawnia cerclae]|uniref:Transglutaminase-like putative cysteine protease n=1 Tax=Brooklawnia cerclae TaxID=349934 RepID=A0ABX0SEH9_9ACTN|nr:transglutaminase family protein [Brooklawnia cerclae]NIH56808.1 transglutaminase-like putative cysteine protease [Brooklawnia cerclae]
MRLRLTHRLVLTTTRPMLSFHGELRLTPCFLDNQSLITPVVDIEPSAWRHEYVDYWGTAVTAFNVSSARKELQITATTELDLGIPAACPPGTSGWDDLADLTLTDAQAEYLQGPDEEVSVPGAWQEWRDSAATPCEFVRGIVDHGLVAPDAVLLVDRVIQAMRWAGIPGRFVSGYLVPEGLDVGDTAEATPHGWLQYWDEGWCDWDPALGASPDQRHLVVGFARDRDDIPLLTGIHGAGEDATTSGTVRVRRLA